MHRFLANFIGHSIIDLLNSTVLLHNIMITCSFVPWATAVLQHSKQTRMEHAKCFSLAFVVENMTENSV